MITNRTNARDVVFRWLLEIAKTAKSENADRTLEKTMTLAEPILSQVASSPAADPEKMTALVARDDFAAIARLYVSKNAFVNLGIFTPGNTAVREVFIAKCRSVSEEAIDIFVKNVGTITDLSGRGISDAIEAVSVKHFCTEAGFAAGHGYGTPILLREMLGLPGDADVCATETRPQVLLNAGKALFAIGVSLSVEARSTSGIKTTEDVLRGILAWHDERYNDEGLTSTMEMNSMPEWNEAAMEVHISARNFINGLPQNVSKADAGQQIVDWHLAEIQKIESTPIRGSHTSEIHEIILTTHRDSIDKTQNEMPGVKLNVSSPQEDNPYGFSI